MKRFASDASRWKAVIDRDPAADGAFVFSVRTTGVYCRPTCPSRRARRENVRFHAGCEEAERAGFRACKRCRPKEALLGTRQKELIARACRMIETAGELPKLAALANEAKLSQFHFHRLFRSVTGVTPKAYAASHRGKRLRKNLSSGVTVTDAALQAGFQSNGRLYASSRKDLGMKPKQFQNAGDGTAIGFAIGESSLGSVLVAATEKGICALFLGSDAEELVRELQDRFRRASIEPGDDDFHRWVASAIAAVERPGAANDLPLDIRGTAFQIRVWRALQSIAAGSTATYRQVAERIGRPTAARAVAAACAANPVAILVPCHRVIRTDESLSGYRWGIERKAELLRRERV